MTFEWKRINKKYYCNNSLSFDIETSSFLDDELDKVGLMYVWQLAISNHTVFIGRTWDDFIMMIKALCKALKLGDDRKIFVFIHNLQFEFQFIRKYLTVTKMLAITERKPIAFETDIGINFRCSYMLTNSKLEKLAEDYNLPHKKAVGYLDYSLLRTSDTELSHDEITYIINDVLVINEYIEMIEKVQYKDIYHIPNTSTGKVRRYIKNKTVARWSEGGCGDHQAMDYRYLMQELKIQSKEEFDMLHKAYNGGFTHANHNYVNLLIMNGQSMDFTSSYPAEMVLSAHYPMGKGTIVEHVRMKDYLDNYEDYYCCVLKIIMVGVREKLKHEHPLSISNCSDVVNADLDNGRIISADNLVTYCTDQDFKIYRDFYHITAIKIEKMIYYPSGYLPKSLINAVLTLYQEKTKLKGVQGSETDYNITKSNLNSVYGCTVMNPFKDIISYDNDAEEWKSESIYDNDELFNDKLKKYNDDKKRFLFYGWGVFITANARYSLFHAIKYLGADYLYADTDSVKYMNPEKHKQWFELYNMIIDSKIKRSSELNLIPIEKYQPMTIKGVKKPIGYFDFDGTFDQFKTLGAKRYMVKAGEEYKITVAGLQKNAVEYIKMISPEQPLTAFNDDLFIPKDYAGKLCHTYIDDVRIGTVTDYQGHSSDYTELSSIHLESIGYDFSISDEFFNYAFQRKVELQ